MSAAIKMDELLVTWLSSDNVHENVMNIIDQYRSSQNNPSHAGISSPPTSPGRRQGSSLGDDDNDNNSQSSPRGVASIPPFYCPPGSARNSEKGKLLLNNKHSFDRDQTWDGIHISRDEPVNTTTSPGEVPPPRKCIKEQVFDIFDELGKKTQNEASLYLTMDNFIKITKEVCSFPSFFNGPLYKRILYLWNTQFVKSEAQRLIIWNEFQKDETPIGVKEFEGDKDELFDHLDLLVNKEIFKWYWTQEMENYDASDRFFRLIKKPFDDHIGKEDFMPYLKELLRDHPVSFYSTRRILLLHSMYILTTSGKFIPIGSRIPFESYRIPREVCIDGDHSNILHS